jgi:hypothetical protein
MVNVFQHRRLVDHYPIQSDGLDRLAKLVEIDGLLDVAVHTQVVAVHQIPFLFRRSHDDHWNRPGPGIALYLPQDVHTIHFRQFQIQQNQLGRMLEGSLAIRSTAE